MCMNFSSRRYFSSAPSKVCWHNRQDEILLLSFFSNQNSPYRCWNHLKKQKELLTRLKGLPTMAVSSSISLIARKCFDILHPIRTFLCPSLSWRMACTSPLLGHEPWQCHYSTHQSLDIFVIDLGGCMSRIARFFFSELASMPPQSKSTLRWVKSHVVIPQNWECFFHVNNMPCLLSCFY